MRLRAWIETLKLRHPFAISRSSRTTQQVVEVELEHESIVGVGEAAPVGFLQESAESALEFITTVGETALGRDPFALEAIGRQLAQYPGHHGAKRALDAALHDWIGKRLGQPIWRILGLERHGPPTSLTIAIDTLAETAARAREASAFEVVKLKLGSPDDLDRLRAVAANTHARIRVDANEGWTFETARELMPELVAAGVELVEQPFAAGDTASYLALRGLRPRPAVIVDEGCTDLASVSPIASYADGINIKLAKSGGLREALRMIHAARALRLSVMLGCMIESELGIAHGAQLASLVDYVDLDGHMLITQSPFRGLGFEGGRVVLADSPGLGVSRIA